MFNKSEFKMKITIPTMLGLCANEISSQYYLQAALLEGVAVYNETNCCKNPENVFGLLTKKAIDIFNSVAIPETFGELTDRKNEAIFAMVYANEKTNQKFEEALTQMMDSIDDYL